MQVALYARVSTLNQQQEGTIASQVQSLHRYIQQQRWGLLPMHEYLDEGVSGARLDRPALDRLRDCAQRGEFDAVVVLSPDRLARNYAHQWLLIEEFEKLQVQWIFLQNPFGDTPQGKLLTQMQGMTAEYERAQIHERTRRGRLEKARRGEFIPWAYRCYGSCSQIVDREHLDGRSELVAIHKEADDGIVHERGFGETKCFSRESFDSGP
jgi:site-specific DNA recombinase